MECKKLHQSALSHISLSNVKHIRSRTYEGIAKAIADQ